MKVRSWFSYLVYWASLVILLVFLIQLPAFAAYPPTETIEFRLPSPPQTQAERKPIVPPLPQRQSPSDRTELAAFVDQFFEQALEKQHVPGAVISIVGGDEILISKGYGYANLEENIPVVADQTLFRMASLSKLFTDTAVMQLSQRGLLELDADVNQYLTNFQINNGYPEPVTAAHLLTQTEGTTQRLIDIAARTPSQMLPLEEYIPEHMPLFVSPPGEIYSYSNMGVTLAGYLVQEISETPFVDYMKNNLLQPLNMERSTFLQPLPSPLNSDLAVGYRYKKGEFQSVPFLYLDIIPAAALSSTATDMAHFMIAHLQNGRYENEQILEPDTVQLMQEQHFVHFPDLPGSAYGFHERYENDLRGIGHSGSLRGYSSGLTLIPEEEIGIFIATNSFNNLHEQFLAQFFDHYYPVQKSAAPPSAPTDFNPERFRGTYRDVEYPQGSFAKLTAPFGHLSVKADDEQTLKLEIPKLFYAGKVPDRRLAPVADTPRLFQQVNDDHYSAFGEDSEGKITYLFNPIGPTIGAYQKISFYETIFFQLAWAGVCLLIFLSAATVWLGGLIKHSSQKQHREKKSARLASFIAGLVSVLYLIFIIGLPLSLWLIGVWKLVYGVPTIAQVLLYLPPLAAGLTVLLLVFTVLAWKNHYWTSKARLYYSVITVGAIAFIPFLFYWHLL